MSKELTILLSLVKSTLKEKKEGSKEKIEEYMTGKDKRNGTNRELKRMKQESSA